MNSQFNKLNELMFLLKEIEKIEIKVPLKFKISKILDEELVKDMMSDIAYMIYYGNFCEEISLNIDSIQKISELMSTYLLQRADIWHSMYIINIFNNSKFIAEGYKRVHDRIYDRLGMAQRSMADLEQLLRLVSLNCQLYLENK